MQIREISLRELIVSVMLRWRGMLVAFLVGTLLFGVFDIVSGKKTDNTVENLQNEGEVISSDLVYNVNRALDFEKLLAQKEEYVNSSILMQMNPNAFIRYECIYAVQTSDLETSKSIAKMYEGLLSAGAIQYCAEHSELTSAQLSEIITLNSSKELETASFSIRIQTATEEQSDLIKDLLLHYYEEKSIELASTIGTHKLILLGEQKATAMDNDMQTYQLNWKEDIFTCRENIRKTKEAFTEEEQALYASIVSGKPMEDKTVEISQEEVSHKNNLSVKKAVIGGVLFFLAYVCVIFCSILFSKKITLLDQATEWFGVSVLGIIYAERKGYFGAGVDSLICRIRNLGRRRITNTETVDLLISDIKRSLRQHNISEITFAGCNIEKEGERVFNQITEALKLQGIITSKVNNLLYKVSSIEALEQSQAVVLIEKCGKATDKEVEREISLMNELSCNLVGMIIVE